MGIRTRLINNPNINVVFMDCLVQEKHMSIRLPAVYTKSVGRHRRFPSKVYPSQDFDIQDILDSGYEVIAKLELPLNTMMRETYVVFKTTYTRLMQGLPGREVGDEWVPVLRLRHISFPEYEFALSAFNKRRSLLKWVDNKRTRENQIIRV